MKVAGFKEVKGAFTSYLSTFLLDRFFLPEVSSGLPQDVVKPANRIHNRSRLTAFRCCKKTHGKPVSEFVGLSLIVNADSVFFQYL